MKKLNEKELAEKIEQLIVESNLSYAEVKSTLSRILVVYQDKGNNLLNATNIQKVIEAPRFIR